MRVNYKFLILVNVLFALNANATEVPDEHSIAGLWINGLNHNTDIGLLKRDNRFYIECAALTDRDIAVQIVKKLENLPEYCLVSEGEITGNFDESSQSIRIIIPSTLFKTEEYGANALAKPEKASFGGFVNYDLFLAGSDSVRDYSGLAEVGFFKDFWIARNSWLYTKSDSEDEIIRLSSSIDIDFPSQMTRLTIGDGTTNINPHINSLRYGGLSWGTTFTEHPDFVYWNMPNLQGSARLPSTVELYINGINIYRQQVSPGDYNLQTGAQIQQGGTAQIVVEDILGNRSVQSFPILVNNKLLKEDLSEYSVTAGKLRYDYNLKSDNYDTFFSNVFYRRGLTNSTSLGVDVVYSQDIQNVGLMWTQALKNWFIFDGLIQSSHDERSGYNYLYGLSASKDFSRFSFGGSVRYADPKFKSLGDDLDGDPSYAKYENLIYLGVSNLPILGNVNLNYVSRQTYARTFNSSELQQILSLGFNRRIGRNLSLGLSYFNSFGDRKDSGATLLLNYNFDNKRTVYLSQTNDNDTSVRFVHRSPMEQGFDYSVGAVQRDGSDTLFNIDGTFKTNAGNLDFQHSNNGSDHDTQVSFRGAMVFLGKQFSFTKPVDYGFALVDVGDYSDITVLRSLSAVNKTNKKGKAFVHDIIPYVPYDIAFDQDQLPIQTKILSSEKRLTGLNQRGYIVNFPVFEAQQVTVKPVDQNGQTFIRGSELHIKNDQTEVYPIASDGTVTLYGLIPNRYKIDVITANSQQCSTELVVSEDKKEQVVPVELKCL